MQTSILYKVKTYYNTLQSYLTNKKFKVRYQLYNDINHITISVYPINSRISQKSALKHILCLIYTANILIFKNNHSHRYFANCRYKVILISHNDFSEASKNLQKNI